MNLAAVVTSAALMAPAEPPAPSADADASTVVAVEPAAPDTAAESPPTPDGPEPTPDTAEAPAPAPAEAPEAAQQQPPPPRPSTSVWRTSEPPPPATNDPQAQPEFRDGVAPGGYWGPGEAPEVAPRDGADKRLAGFIMVPLGLLTVASAAPMVYFTAPGKCISRTAKIGFNLDEDECQGLLILNSVRVGYGALAAISGAVLLAIGYKEKRRLEEWKRRRFRASLQPSGSALSAHFSFRF